MRILAIGDIFGKLGRQVVKKKIPELKEKYQIDLVVANVENATHGKGISYAHYEDLKFTKEKKVLIDIMTSGNHIFHREETQKKIKDFSDLIRPLNIANPYYPGQGTILKEVNNKNIRITNLLGTTFMPLAAENPYWVLEKIVNLRDYDLHLVDFHAETTAEKIALAHHFDGKITALWGTHTHVQTADERKLPKGTAFITDLGMTGPHRGIIGAKPEAIIRRTRDGLPAKMVPADDKEDRGQFNGVIFEFDDITNKVISIKRINEIL